MATFVIWTVATDDSVPLVGWIGLGVATVVSVSAWVEQVVIVGPVLYHRGTFRWRPPLRAEDVEEVTLYYDPGGWIGFDGISGC